MGDGVLAYFGYPQAREDDTERAVMAGLDLVAAIAGLNTGPGVTLSAFTRRRPATYSDQQ
jgi:class 3 adenylate cyclase